MTLYSTPAKTQPPIHPTDEFKIHVALADRAGCSAYRLWAYCRSLDPQGSGWATIGIDEVMEALGAGYSTVQRWLKGKTFFRCSIRMGPRQYRVFYRATHQVYRSLCLTSLGMVGYVDRSALKNPNTLKALATELTIAGLQKQALYAASRNQPVLAKQGKIIDPLKLLKSDSSRYSCGVTLDQRFLRLGYNAPVVPHTTQIAVSEQLGRSVSTIQRRTASAWRASNGLNPLRSLRQIRKLNPAQTEHHQLGLDRLRYLGECDDASIDRYKKQVDSSSASPDRKKQRRQVMLTSFRINPRSSTYQHVSNFEDGFYFMGGNIYETDLETITLKNLRSSLKRLLVGGLNK